MLQNVNNTSTAINTTCEPTEDEWEVYNQTSWLIQGIASPLISIFGFLLNSVAIATLISSKKTESFFFNRLLVCLAVFDNLYLLNGVSEAIRRYAIQPNYFYDFAFINFLFPFRSMVMFCSMYSTIVLAFVRHDAIKRPLRFTVRLRQESTGSYFNLMYYIFPVVLASVIFYLPKFFEFDITYSPEACLHYSLSNINSTSKPECPYKDYVITETWMRQNKSYILWYLNVLNHIITIIVPFILLVYFNVGIYREMKTFIRRRTSSRRRIKNNQPINQAHKTDEPEKNEQSITIFSLILMFLSCHMLRVVLNIQESVYFEWKFKELQKGCAGVRFWAMILVPFSELMLLTNSSANFFIYYLFQNDFRKEIKIKLKKKISCCVSLNDKDEVTKSRVRDSSSKRTRIRKVMSSFSRNSAKQSNRFSGNKKAQKAEHIEMVEIPGEAL